tara:strand:- start:4602 stop:4928 length:327 start_codon:yes stop_codon:yes gene_type:complete
MRITERRLRNIIRSIILESDESDIYAPFDDDSDMGSDMEIIDADDIHQLDQPAPKRGETRDFMRRNRRAGAERDRGDRVLSRGTIHSSQLDMLDDMGELSDYDDDYDY